MTPGEPPTTECLKGHWLLMPSADREKYRGCIRSAQTCADFKEEPSAPANSRKETT